MVQLSLLHAALWYGLKERMDSLFYRGARHFSLPWRLYGAGGVLVLFGVCVIGLLALLVFYLGYRRFRGRCIRSVSQVEDEEICSQYQEECQALGIREEDRRRLFYSRDIASPFVLGFIRPLLLLPLEDNQGAVKENLGLLLRHECIHMKQKDTWYKLFMLVCNCLLWFQPLAYLVRYLSYRDIEIACDEAVVAGKSSQERAEYGQFLIDSLKRDSGGSYAYSAFFLGGKKLMKARISAVMEVKRRWNFLAGAAVAVMLAEICGLGVWLGQRAVLDYKGYQESRMPVNIYEGYEVPEGFTDHAVENMLIGPPREEMEYSRMILSQETNAAKESYEELPYPAEGPWQVRILDYTRFGDCLNGLFTRYSYAGREQEWDSLWDPEQIGSYSSFDMIYRRLLAGNGEEAVWGVIFKEYHAQYGELSAYQEGWAQAAEASDGTYVYYPVAMHVKMVKDYVFELEGISSLFDAVKALRQAYPDNDYSDVPRLCLRNPVDQGEDGAAPDRDGAQKSDAGENSYGADSGGIDSGYAARISGDKLWIRRGENAEWEETPVTPEEVLERGDDMDGPVTRLQEGSYQCDERKVIFAYGGSYAVRSDFSDEGALPVTVEYYDEENGAWRKSVVTDQYLGGRRMFVSFPEDSSTGFLLMTTERVMWQEGTVLFGTRDGGATWKLIGPAGLETMADTHSLTTDAVFLSNDVGFLTIRSSEEPDIWRTGDGGRSWQPVELKEVPRYYCMAYAPETEDGNLVMYVGMEDYSEYGGTKARYVSGDEGLNWEYQGLVLRQ